MAATEPIARRVTRYICPFCSRGHAHRAKAVEHVARCWKNPAARSCKTCTHFLSAVADCEPGCGCGNPDDCMHPEGPGLNGALRTGCPLWEAS